MLCGLCGCILGNRERLLGNREWLNEPLLQLPSGDEVVAKTEFYRGLAAPTQLVWKKPGQPLKIMEIVPKRSEGELPIGPEEVRRAQVHTNDDRSRIWLVEAGRVIASFDYAAGQAVFEGSAQPDWARLAK
jgi:hypothetical protein